MKGYLQSKLGHQFSESKVVCFSSEKHSAILPLLKVLVSAHPHYYYIGWRGGELQLIVLESSLCQISEKFGILDTSHSHKADNVL